MLVLYMLSQVYKPKEYDWAPTLQSNDKDPYGTFILYQQIKELFPSTSIQSHRIPVYNLLHNNYEYNTAYVFIEPEFNPGEPDTKELLEYAEAGNTVFISCDAIEGPLADSLGFRVTDEADFFSGDSSVLNLVNPKLKMAQGIGFKKATITGYFDSLRAVDSIVVLGVKNDSLPNFIKLQYGQGAFLLHTAPISFTNAFMLTKNHHDYVSKVLSYLPADIETLHWDEYYKQGREGPSTPLRFFLTQEYLKWALWIAVIALVIYILFHIKRRQRIIPVIEPLRNTTLDFTETVSAVYFSQHDNNTIAAKKIQFWNDYVRQYFYLSVQQDEDNFATQLQRKSGVPKEDIDQLLHLIKKANTQPRVTDDLLLQLSRSIDEFYKQSKL